MYVLSCQEAELAVEHEASLRQQLRRQAAAYSDHLAEVLRVQATELDKRCVLQPIASFLDQDNLEFIFILRSARLLRFKAGFLAIKFFRDDPNNH